MLRLRRTSPVPCWGEEQLIQMLNRAYAMLGSAPLGLLGDRMMTPTLRTIVSSFWYYLITYASLLSFSIPCESFKYDPLGMILYMILIIRQYSSICRPQSSLHQTEVSTSLTLPFLDAYLYVGLWRSQCSATMGSYGYRWAGRWVGSPRSELSERSGHATRVLSEIGSADVVKR